MKRNNAQPRATVPHGQIPQPGRSINPSHGAAMPHDKPGKEARRVTKQEITVSNSKHKTKARNVANPAPARSADPRQRHGKHVAQPPSAVQKLSAKPGPDIYRRNLPHIQASGKPHFITFKTKDRLTLPESVRGTVLRHCLHDDGKKCVIHAAVVMPDHVHLILTPCEDVQGKTFRLSEILSGIKGASAHAINKALERKGHVWQDESFDHVLRSMEDLEEKGQYICENPVRKGLAKTPTDWPWLWAEWMRADSSATDRNVKGGIPNHG